MGGRTCVAVSPYIRAAGGPCVTRRVARCLSVIVCVSVCAIVCALFLLCLLASVFGDAPRGKGTLASRGPRLSMQGLVVSLRATQAWRVLWALCSFLAVMLSVRDPSVQL